MKNRENQHLQYLERWVLDLDRSLCSSNPILLNRINVDRVSYAVSELSAVIKNEYPFYASELPTIAKNLFRTQSCGVFTVNTAAFGELYLIIKHLVHEPSNTQFWQMIHPRICAVSKDLYCDGYYGSAAEKAVKEVETRLRELYQEIKPGAGVPRQATDIIGALLGDQGSYQFCDTSTSSGQNYRRGIKLLFEGLFAAYRNPSAHENVNCTRRVAFDQITLSSQLMFVMGE